MFRGHFVFFNLYILLVLSSPKPCDELGNYFTEVVTCSTWLLFIRACRHVQFWMN